MLHKPRGYITTLSDERGRRTAASLVDCGTRVYPVGRLDYDSEGLLLFTNDGALADRLMHPRREISKVYEVTARGPLDGAAERLRRPLALDGYRIRSCRSAASSASVSGRHAPGASVPSCSGPSAMAPQPEHLQPGRRAHAADLAISALWIVMRNRPGAVCSTSGGNILQGPAPHRDLYSGEL